MAAVKLKILSRIQDQFCSSLLRHVVSGTEGIVSRARSKFSLVDQIKAVSQWLRKDVSYMRLVSGACIHWA